MTRAVSRASTFIIVSPPSVVRNLRFDTPWQERALQLLIFEIDFPGAGLYSKIGPVKQLLSGSEPDRSEPKPSPTTDGVVKAVPMTYHP